MNGAQILAVFIFLQIINLKVLIYPLLNGNAHNPDFFYPKIVIKFIRQIGPVKTPTAGAGGGGRRVRGWRMDWGGPWKC